MKDSSGPIFIIGCPRSGTSALSWSLAQHSGLWTSEESDFLYHLFGKAKLHHAYKAAYDRKDCGWLNKNKVTYDEFAMHLGQGINQLFLSRSQGKRWIDATPGHTLMADELALMFPEARFIHIIRDGRAVTNSMINSQFEIDWANNFEIACKTWVHFVKRGLEFQRQHTDRCIEIRHENLLAKSSFTLNEISKFLGIQHESSMELFIQNNRINSSYGNIGASDMRRPKSALEIPDNPWNSWDMKRAKIFQEIAGSTMKKLGYTIPSRIQR